MAQISNIGVQGYDIRQSACMCCFAKNVPFIRLGTCKHAKFLDFCFNFKMELDNNVVCNHCHNLLKNIDKFNNQVQRTSILFNEKNLHHKILGGQKLQLSQTKVLSIIPETPEYENVIIKTEPEPIEEFEEVKEECDKIEITVEIKQERVSEEKEEKKEITLDESLAKELEITVLNREEMEKERELLRTDEKYMKRPFKCDKCIVGFDHEINLNLHLEKKHNEAAGCEFTCPICECVYTSDVALRTHSKRHFTRFKCKTCNKPYLDERSAVLHYREKHGVASHNYSCKFADCNFETRSHRAYTYHISRHKQDPCKYCGKLYMRGTQLRLHINTVHEKASVFKCELCDKQYKHRSGLSVHMESAHGAGRTAYCSHCRTHFRTEQILARHMRHHSTHVDKKFICDECGSRFATKSNLKYHIELAHLKLTYYKCQYCNKALGTARSLRRHVQFVHENKQLPRDKICDFCGKAFTSVAYLQTHRRTHTNERPHQCTHCAASFTHPAALYNHMKQLHETTVDNEQPDIDNQRQKENCKREII